MNVTMAMAKNVLFSGSAMALVSSERHKLPAGDNDGEH